MAQERLPRRIDVDCQNVTGQAFPLITGLFLDQRYALFHARFDSPYILIALIV